MYEPITVQIDSVDRGYGEGDYRSYSLNFIGRLIQIVEDSNTTMRLYEWADRGRLEPFSKRMNLSEKEPSALQHFSRSALLWLKC